jgi:RNA polymerase sigma-70 factor (ECF subfamily)
MLAVAEPEQLPITAAKAGDPVAWEALFRRYQMPLYVYVAELTRDERFALDIVQDTFVTALRHLASLRDDEKFGSWLFRIAHQKCIQQWRKNAREQTALEAVHELAPPDGDSPNEIIIREEQEALLMQLIAILPPPQRSVLLLYFVEDFSLEEIAAITGSQLGTVKSRLHYAKKALRQMLENQIT